MTPIGSVQTEKGEPMGSYKYYIEVDGETLAWGMTLECATILIKAMMETYWREVGLKIVIGRDDMAIKAAD